MYNMQSYQFSNPCFLKGNDTNYDVSNIEVDLSQILRGGIGRGASSPQLLANGMRMIGHVNGIFNLPYCIEKRNSTFAIMTHGNQYCGIDEVKNALNSIDHFHVPLDIDGHASLASVVIKEGKAKIQFFDSLSWQEMDYSARYSEDLIRFIHSLLPVGVQVLDRCEVVHFSDQGGPETTGCGYYALYTALLLTERKDLKEFADHSILVPADDAKIRAELAVRTLLWYGVEKAEKEIDRLRYFGDMPHVFHKLEASALDKLIQSIYQNSERL